ncbi:hypothetical protein CCACVL1_15220 [Corchorus capsularis]|uniref:Uncharacterized protein n=1 Tax=Corchorus capsularis TaxID=210143 RepID=A0A1R3I397_COCAP|nr:hypothetical protein CCACVL1_15220 [Corchorus capsularis]
MGSVTADFVVGHEDTQDDPKRSKDEKGDGEADLLERRAIVDGVGCLHHDILVGDGEGMVDELGLDLELFKAKEEEASLYLAPSKAESKAMLIGCRNVRVRGTLPKRLGKEESPLIFFSKVRESITPGEGSAPPERPSNDGTSSLN